MSVFIRTTSGGKSVTDFIVRVQKAYTPTAGDALHAGAFQVSRLSKRTDSGHDAEGKIFAPYSKNGPYYYNPNGRVNPAERRQISLKSQKTKVTNALKNRGIKGAQKSSTGKSIRFENYAAYKRWTGARNVNLRGPSAPGMRDAIQMKAGGRTFYPNERRSMFSVTSNRTHVSELRIGVYGDEAKKATGHQYGNPATKLPKRQFLGATGSDLRSMTDEMMQHMRARASKK